MSPFKQGVILVLVVLAILMSGLGGLCDLLGAGVLPMSSQHGWADAQFLVLLAILAALTLK